MIIKIPTLYPSVQRIGLGLLYFLFLYSIQFAFVPGSVGTRVLIGMWGFVLVVLKVVNKLKNGALKVDKDQFRIMICLVALMSVSFFTNSVNSTSDNSIISYVVSLCVILFASYAVSRATQAVYREVRFELVSRYIIIAVVGQMILATVMFLVPSFQNALMSLTAQLDITISLFDETEGFRILGFGAVFFAAGVINGFTLILIAAMMRSRNSELPQGFLIGAFLLITFIGSMMARTTLVGTAMGACVMLWDSRIFRLKISARLRKVLRILLLIVLFVVVAFMMLPESVREQIGVATEFGFEMIYNYFDSGTLSTTSTDQLGSMYEVYPTELNTWIIGDGLWITDPNDVTTYYAGVDVGFTRLIFYFGVVGTAIFFYYQAALLLAINGRTNREYSFALFMIFIYILALGFKGFCDLTPIVSLFLFVTLTQTQTQTDEKN